MADDSLDHGRPAKRIRLEPRPQPAHTHLRPHQQQQQQQQRLIKPAPPAGPPAAAAAAPVAHTWVHVVPSARGGRRNRRRGRGRGGARAAASGSDAPRPFSRAPADAVAPASAAPDTGSSPASTESTSSPTSTSTSTSTSLWMPHDPMRPAAAMTTEAPLEAPLETPLPPLGMTPPPAELNFSPASYTSLHHSPSSEQQPRPPWTLPASPNDAAQLSLPQAELEHRRHRPQPGPHGFVSPFKDCLETFGKLTSMRFPRPSDGRVNSYIKFNWPQRRTQAGRSSSVSLIARPNDAEDNQAETDNPPPSVQSSSVLIASNRRSTHRPAHRSAQAPTQATARWRPSSQRKYDRSLSFSGSGTLPSAIPGFLFSSRSAPSWSHGWVGHPSQNAPRMLPPHFGLSSKMDRMDRLLWDFYVGNWCPGRSILGKTNLWLQDFAAMEGCQGVLCAIQSLAGIYIYDYQPLEGISRRVNRRFAMAEGRLSHLLAKENLCHSEASELITISSILSMQDIVLTERRLKRPHNPRWLDGFKQSAYFLETFDEGSRFWSKTNVQLSSLRISQSIIVGRAVILSQLMTDLPPLDTFDPEEETGRFGWLLDGNMEDMYEIHGGCGFSKKLLHSMSQITYCVARLCQCPESPVVPITIKFLLSELLDMRQWSSAPDSDPWEIAKTRPQTIERVRAAPEGFVIDDASSMTEVTAEAWRIAAIVYSQCRALRLPRNHPDVLANLTDLAKCINIMPTSGYNFTAQAPLFPVFLLGMLATVPEHVAVAQAWFESVTSTPVRSSVPPLYGALKRIWMWIDTEPSLMLPLNAELDDQIANRQPWWEYLVQRVLEEESEILCLT
ncbi:zinc finger protein [Trichoderma cornu-damae]|uniref:Zinc finger protein n=1 Tax=Trichoderma cornu-damae TaxID=654480 RepID=A0A9P8QGM8_9HYPO|nr:zinc finger protein [Trichoderma cornu-damae]